MSRWTGEPQKEVQYEAEEIFSNVFVGSNGDDNGTCDGVCGQRSVTARNERAKCPGE